MALINLYLYNPYKVSASYSFSRFDTSVNADADAQCDQGLNVTKTGISGVVGLTWILILNLHI